MTALMPAEEKKDSSVLEDMKKENEVLAGEIKKREDMLAKRDELKAREMLGGKANAGIEPPKPLPETAKEYADKVMTGKVKAR